MARVPETAEESGDEGTRGPVPAGASFCVKRGFYEGLEVPVDREWLVIGRGRGADVVFSEHCERTTHDFWSIRFKRIENYRSPCAHGRPVRRAGDHVHDLFD